MAEVIQNLTCVADFDAVLKSAGSKPVIVDFTATWCGPCKAISPFYHELAEQYSGKAIFCKCDVDAAQDLALQEGITAMPTFKFYSKGVVAQEFRGANKDLLKSTCAAVVSKNA
uniref:Thioredoxin domain-containing protein n=1 Tax=Spongospora subterranea TaxID=70186 RepID=A0A0H5R412_9EUKA|eukprot:CRZ08940.1 hypothetical protein [Spongospora subterranea]